MKKTIYRIELLPIGGNSLTNDLTLLAAMFNGGATQNTLAHLKKVADANILLYPESNRDTYAELYDNDLLHIGRKVNDTMEAVLKIQAVEILELAAPWEGIEDTTNISQQGQQC